MLNSWGTTKSRPDGLFMVRMDMNYGCTYTGLGYAYYWMTLEADFDRASLPKIMLKDGVGFGPRALAAGTQITSSLVSRMPFDLSL